MMDLMQAYIGDIGHWHSTLSHLDISHLVSMDAWPTPDSWTVLAQEFEETDISGDIGSWWNNVVKTGQIWAFLLGAIFGYLAKSFTTYG